MVVAVLKNIECEGLGLLGEFMEKNSIEFKELDVFAGQKIPNIKQLSVLIVLGGPMNVYEEQQFSFLRFENAAIKAALHFNIPILGICLGGQLLAKALAAKVTKNTVKEIGASEIKLTADGRKSNLFNGTASSLDVFQWHGDTFAIPKKALRLATSKLCKNQCFSFKENAFALQFHLELTMEMLKEWADEYNAELSALEIDKNKLVAEFSKKQVRIGKNAETVFCNFFETAGLL